MIRKVVRVHGHGQCDERNDHDDPDVRGFSFVVVAIVVAVYSNPSGGAAPRYDRGMGLRSTSYETP